MSESAAPRSDDLRTVADVGERELLRLLSPYLAAPGGEVLISIGDDCAVWQTPGKPETREILTTDLLVEGTHFLRDPETDWRALGRKAVAANISDVASMGARPGALLVSLAIPGDLRIRDLLHLYEGLSMEAARWGGALVGGDTTRSPIVVINVAVTGFAQDEHALPLRSNCRVDQHVYLSGSLGGSLAGLRLLSDPAYKPWRTSEFAAALIQRHRQPEPRVPLGRKLAAACPDLAMVDISDGLYNELRLLAEASGVGFVIDLDTVPLWNGVPELAEASGVSPDEFRLFSGEEYELLFATQLDEPALREALRGVEPEITRIGRVIAYPGIELRRAGAPVLLSDQTFQHFR